MHASIFIPKALYREVSPYEPLMERYFNTEVANFKEDSLVTAEGEKEKEVF